MTKLFPSLRSAVVLSMQNLLNLGIEVETKNWQGTEVNTCMIENFNYNFSAPIEIDSLKASNECGATQPWADTHFQERISGHPLNPGESYKIWPYYGDDEKWRTDDRFSHTYMERFWPKQAGDNFDHSKFTYHINNRGIRYEYGDLKDVINLLRRDIHTRQAFLPVWFPEDTGANDGQRVPCTLGYLFNYRNGYLHCTYYIRSCDAIRHFQNDVYLTNQLAAYVYNNLSRFFLGQPEILPGHLIFNCTSFHIFKNEKYILEKKLKELV